MIHCSATGLLTMEIRTTVAPPRGQHNEYTSNHGRLFYNVILLLSLTGFTLKLRPGVPPLRRRLRRQTPLF